MEILSVFGVDWKLIAVQSVNFFVVLFLLKRYLYQPLFAIIDKRTQIITKSLNDAEEIANEHAKLALETADLMKSARTAGEQVIDQARKQAESTERELLKEAQSKSARIVAEAVMRAKDERAHMLKESEKEVSRLAILGAEKILRQGNISTSTRS